MAGGGAPGSFGSEGSLVVLAGGNEVRIESASRPPWTEVTRKVDEGAPE